MAIALSRRGGEAAAAIELRLHAGADPNGHPAHERKWLRESRTSLLKSTLDSSELKQFRKALARGAWVMVHIFGPRWVARLPRGASGPWGALCPGGDAPRPLHSVILVATEPVCFFVLDPFLSRDLQPFQVSDAELLAVLSGFSSVVIEA